MSGLLENVTREKLMLVLPQEQQADSEDIVSDDPLMDLMNEFSAYEVAELEANKKAIITAPEKVTVGLREDVAWVTLGHQLEGLRDGLQRLHYYLSDVDDNLRR